MDVHEKFEILASNCQFFIYLCQLGYDIAGYAVINRV